MLMLVRKGKFESWDAVLAIFILECELDKTDCGVSEGSPRPRETMAWTAVLVAGDRCAVAAVIVYCLCTQWHS